MRQGQGRRLNYARCESHTGMTSNCSSRHSLICWMATFVNCIPLLRRYQQNFANEEFGNRTFAYLGNAKSSMPDIALPPGYAAENKGPLILAMVWGLTLSSALMVIGRVFVRIRKLGRMQKDDYVIILSLVSI